MPSTSVTAQPGQTVTLAQRFLRDGAPLVVSEPISYTVRSANGLQLAYGVASQTSAQPEEWTATFTVPAQAEPGEYEVTWTAKLSGNREVERTSTLSVGAPISVVDEAVSIYAGEPLADTLTLDSAASNVTVDVLDPAGTVVGTYSVSSAEPDAAGRYHYSFEGLPTTRNVGHNGVLPYGIHWRFTQAGERQLVTRSAYVFDHRMISQIETLQRFLDKARTLDVNPSLRFTTVELAHFLLMGLQRLNGVPPSGAYTVASLPQGLYYAWQRCAAHEALNALYLAVGTSTFNFSGQGSQIEYDMGPAIQTKMDELGQWIDTQLPIMKRELKRKGNVGVLGISFGPSINYPSLNGTAEAIALLSRGSRFFQLL